MIVTDLKSEKRFAAPPLLTDHGINSGVSVPIAGRDGTLRGRLAAETGRVFAKTGSLTYDHALSGYVVTASGDIFSFSVFCNDATEQTHPVRIIDEIVTLLVNYDDSKPPRSGQK